MFKHLGLPPLPTLSEEMVNGRRYYITDDGVRLPSVTTMLNSQPKPEIEAWKKRVGVVKAEQIKVASGNRGNKLHNTIDDYLNNKPIVHKPLEAESDVTMFNSIKAFLNKIDSISYLEAKLFSKKIGLAGRTDCIGTYSGVPSVIDFKNARKRRTEKMIHTYFLQCTAYGGLYEDMTGIKIKQGVIIMAVENDFPQVFKFDLVQYVPDLIEAIKIYKKFVDNQPTL